MERNKKEKYVWTDFSRFQFGFVPNHSKLNFVLNWNPPPPLSAKHPKNIQDLIFYRSASKESGETFSNSPWEVSALHPTLFPFHKSKTHCKIVWKAWNRIICLLAVGTFGWMFSWPSQTLNCWFFFHGVKCWFSMKEAFAFCHDNQ